MTINTSGRCSKCGGTVRNIEGKRYRMNDLERIHNEVCPGMRGKRKEQTS